MKWAQSANEKDPKAVVPIDGVSNRVMDDAVMRKTSHCDLLEMRVDDGDAQALAAKLSSATAFIHKKRNENRAVLIHCAAGRSRSPAVVIAYLVRYEDMTLHDAYLHVKRNRQCIDVDSAFLKPLQEWEIKWRDVNESSVKQWPTFAEDRVFECIETPCELE